MIAKITLYSVCIALIVTATVERATNGYVPTPLLMAAMVSVFTLMIDIGHLTTNCNSYLKKLKNN